MVEKGFWFIFPWTFDKLWKVTCRDNTIFTYHIQDQLQMWSVIRALHNVTHYDPWIQGLRCDLDSFKAPYSRDNPGLSSLLVILYNTDQHFSLRTLQQVLAKDYKGYHPAYMNNISRWIPKSLILWPQISTG